MCKNCGCSAAPQESPARDHLDVAHDTLHQTIAVHERLLANNDRHAAQNRDGFERTRTLVINLLSSPGSGKTTLLERTLTELSERLCLGVIVGDLQTDNDARRLRGRGAAVTAVTTGTLCHLEADMIERACREFDTQTMDIFFIENVGNLVCPASFDLGEAIRVVVLSTTEGEDKPLKYPLAFRTAQVVIVNKMDLAHAAGFDREAALANIQGVAPSALVMELSARTGVGMAAWYEYLERQMRTIRKSP